MILASAQVYPEVWQEVLRLVEGGRLEEARAAQRRVQHLSRIFCRHGGGVAVKAAWPTGGAAGRLACGG